MRVGITYKMAHLRQDYLKLKQADFSLNCDDWSKADRCFSACNQTSKIQFNRGVLRLWSHDRKEAEEFFKRSLALDRYLSVAGFYLGCLCVRREAFEEALRFFQDSLIGFRESIPKIDYTQLGMPFILKREDVQFNVAALLRKLFGETDDAFIASIKGLPLDCIRCILATEVSDNLALREPPWMDRRMVFNLLPKKKPETVELVGPEFVGLLEGECYLGGFEDAQTRTVNAKIIISCLFSS